ncbi:MAG: mechanosensitive ion channel family protein, partial [Clostridia bacterium]|nr:mechanosensitive ion channel family protein [Clostridia bacterium]
APGIGDYIDAQNASGTVRDISVFYTVLVTPDNKVITVPNGGLTNSVITNYSVKETRRIDVVFSADYKHDSDEVKAIMLSVAESCAKALKDPAPAAIMSDCADSGINYTLRVWSNNADYWDVREELVSGVRKAFKDANIEIPYPQVDVHIKNEE